MIRFEPRYAISHVVVVGLGGTGSQLARSIARIVFDMGRRSMHVPSLTFVDPDVVEEKNVGRQAGFAPADIGYYKVQSLARCFNAALGLDIAWDAAPFDLEKHAGRYGTLLVDCVDNHLARRTLAEFNGLTVSCGNHAWSGQVVCGNSSDPVLVRDALEKDNGVISVLPNAPLLFPELLEPEPEPAPAGDRSCADLVDSGQQGLLVNDQIAVVAAHYIYRLMHRLSITTFLSFCNSDDCFTVRSIPISREAILEYLDRM